MEYASKNSSLNWYDCLFIRILKHYKGESRWSLEHSDMAYLFKLGESLDIDEFIQDVYDKNPPKPAKS